MANPSRLILEPPPLQQSVDRFARALASPHKLLSLHPRTVGNPGNAAALSPAIVQGCIAAFEGFAEDFTAIMMAKTDSSYAEISKRIGGWNNPDIDDFASSAKRQFLPAGVNISGGPVKIHVNTTVGKSNWVEREIPWADVLSHSQAWMQVRHLLTHGLVTGWRSEWWPGPARADKIPASTVLRAMGNGKHSLVIHGAISCARIYTIGAKYVADTAATQIGETLDWADIPVFD